MTLVHVVDQQVAHGGVPDRIEIVIRRQVHRIVAKQALAADAGGQDGRGRVAGLLEPLGADGAGGRNVLLRGARKDRVINDQHPSPGLDDVHLPRPADGGVRHCGRVVGGQRVLQHVADRDVLQGQRKLQFVPVADLIQGERSLLGPAVQTEHQVDPIDGQVVRGPGGDHSGPQGGHLVDERLVRQRRRFGVVAHGEGPGILDPVVGAIDGETQIVRRGQVVFDQPAAGQPGNPRAVRISAGGRQVHARPGAPVGPPGEIELVRVQPGAAGDGGVDHVGAGVVLGVGQGHVLDEGAPVGDGGEGIDDTRARVVVTGGGMAGGFPQGFGDLHGCQARHTLEHEGRHAGHQRAGEAGAAGHREGMSLS
jgi:hypothetical protein